MGRPIALTVLLGLALFACDENKNEGMDRARRLANPPGLALSVCGPVAAYQAATSRDEGRVAFERGAWPIAAGVTIDEQVTLAAGAEICLEAQLDESRRIAHAVVRAPIAADWPTE